MNKESLSDFIKQNKFSLYNNQPKNKPHYMQEWPIITVCIGVIIMALCWNYVKGLKYIQLYAYEEDEEEETEATETKKE
jgi:hypothetical protein